MGLLVEGRWQDRWYDTASTGGAFKRQESQFRNWVTPDGSASTRRLKRRRASSSSPRRTARAARAKRACAAASEPEGSSGTIAG